MLAPVPQPLPEVHQSTLRCRAHKDGPTKMLHFPSVRCQAPVSSPHELHPEQQRKGHSWLARPPDVLPDVWLWV